MKIETYTAGSWQTCRTGWPPATTALFLANTDYIKCRETAGHQHRDCWQPVARIWKKTRRAGNNRQAAGAALRHDPLPRYLL